MFLTVEIQRPSSTEPNESQPNAERLIRQMQIPADRTGRDEEFPYISSIDVSM